MTPQGRSIWVGRTHQSSGTVSVGGYKHALVPIISACVARRGQAQILNVPNIKEAEIFGKILVELGAEVDFSNDKLRIDCTHLHGIEVDPDLSMEIHGSLYLIPALIAAVGRVRFKDSGGCRIGDASVGGERPVRHMTDVLCRFGADFRVDDGWLVGKARGLRATDIDIMDYSERPDLLTGPLVSGATKTSIIAALGAEGLTKIYNPYPKPDVTELLDFISSVGDSVQKFEGSVFIRKQKCSRFIEHSLISDLSEIITYVSLAVMTGITLTIEGITSDRLRVGLGPELALLDAMEVPLYWESNSVRIIPPLKVRSVDIEVTSVGIYSDHQPFFALMMLKGDRPARIREHVWKNRFDYARELKKLGAQIHVGDGEILVAPSRLRGPAHMNAKDLRAAAVLLIAAVAAGGACRLDGVEHLLRGYSGLVENLRSLGVEAEDI